MAFFTDILNKNIILEALDSDEKEVLDSINPSGVEKPNTKENNSTSNDNNKNKPSTDSTKDKEETEQDTSDDDESSFDSDEDDDQVDSNDEVESDEIENQDTSDGNQSMDDIIKNLESELDKDLSDEEKINRKKILYNSFMKLYNSFTYIYELLEFLFNKFNLDNEEYNDVLKSFLEVKKSLYIYMTELYDSKSFIESKYYYSNICIYLNKINEFIKGVKIENNAKV